MTLRPVDVDDPAFSGSHTVALQGRRLPIPRGFWPALPSWALRVRACPETGHLRAADAGESSPGVAGAPDSWLPLDDLGRVRLPQRLWRQLGEPDTLRLIGHGRELAIEPATAPARAERPPRPVDAPRSAGAAGLPAFLDR